MKHLQLQAQPCSQGCRTSIRHTCESFQNPSGPSVHFEELGRVGAKVGTREAIVIRNKFCEYFQSVEGRLPWQETVVHRGTPHEQQ